MGEKIITVLSNASLDHYPQNKISNFRNKLYSPISLTDGDYEIAVLGCSYNASKVIISENDEIGKYFNPDTGFEQVLRAPFAMTSFEQLFTFIGYCTKHKFEIDPFGFVTRTALDPRFKSFTPSERVANVLGITAVRYGGNLIVPEKYKFVNTGSKTPHLLPIQYDVNDILYWLPLKNGETEAVAVRATKVTTFDELMKNFPRNNNEKIEQFSATEWQVTVKKSDRVKFNNCKETDFMEHDGGYVTFFVEHNDPTVYFKKGEYFLRVAETGEKMYASKDLRSFQDLMLEYERAIPGMIVFFSTNGKISRTMSTDDVGDQSHFTKPFMHTFKLLEYFGITNIDVGHFNMHDSKEYTGAYRPVSNLGTSQLLLYCDLIHPQHIGNTVAPLLRSFHIEYDGAEHIFHSPLYFPIARDYVDVVHMYIMCENGEPPPFEFGTFTATLGIRKKISY